MGPIFDGIGYAGSGVGPGVLTMEQWVCMPWHLHTWYIHTS